MPDDKSTEVLAAWETSSQYWSKHRSLIEKMYTPLTEALIDDAHIAAGQSVLDIGGGAGEPSLSIARVVGDSGTVTFTDPAEGMVKATQAEAARRGLKNIQFHQCPADHLPFPDSTFDAAVSRLSTMFFPEVSAGLHEILRVTRPGGYVSLLVWASKEANPFFSVVSEIIERFVPSEPEDEDAPGAFRFSRSGKLANLLESAGAMAVKERSVAFNVEAPITAAQFWELRTEVSDTFRTKLAKLSTEEVAAMRAEVIRAVASYFKTGSMKFPSQVLTVSARK